MSDYSGSHTSRITRERYSAPERSRSFATSATPGRYTYSVPFDDKESYGADDLYSYVPRRGTAHYSAHPTLRSYAPDADSDADVDVDDDQPRARAYRFRLDRASPTPTEPTEDDFSEDEPIVAERLLAVSARRARSVMNIVESKYTGLGVLERPHGARVTVVEGSGAAKPLFRWIHFPWKEKMDLDDFADEVSRTPGLTATELHTLADLLDEVRRKHVRALPTTGPRPARTMTPFSLQRTIPPDDALAGRATSTPRTATWVCVPYLSLEAYSRLDSASGFPAKTLLQMQYSRAGKARDMQQAVCMNGGVPAGHCYHIAQLWCLVLDNSLLFTCCRLPETSLLGDSIQRVIRPDTVKPKIKISVVYRGSVMWSIPLQRCETFFSFISHFREVWPRRLLFYRHGRRITPDYWPKILRAASRTGVTLDLKIGKPPAPPPRGVLTKPPEDKAEPDPNPTDKPSDGPPLKPSQKPPAPTSHFAVLTCLDGVSAADPFDRPALEKQLEKVHQLLLRDTSFRDRKMYRSCPEDSRTALYQFLEAGGAAQQEGNSDAAARRQKIVEDKIDLFNSVDAVFRFFFPARSEGIPTVGKYWGAIGRVLRGSSAISDTIRDGIHRSPQFDFASSMLRFLASRLESFNDVFKHATRDDRAGIVVPDELMEAWMHVLMGLVYFTSDREVAADLISDASSLIDESLKSMVMGMSDHKLRAQAVLLPMEFVCLISLELMSRPPPGLPDITTTYADRLAAINNEVVSKPSDRSHERNIDLLRQEVLIIRGLLASQADVFTALVRDARNTAGGAQPSAKRDDEWEDEKMRIRSTSRALPGVKGGKLSLTGVEAGGYADLLADECLIHVERLEDEFKQIRDQARWLSDFNQNKVDTTKDRQERAIYVFTIVTIIFLPLSAVSSIFGMNTSDIRDMELSQWAYWAAALPITAAVIFLGLLFTGELRNFLRWAVEGAKRNEGMFEGMEGERFLGRGETEHVERPRRGDNPRVHWS